METFLVMYNNGAGEAYILRHTRGEMVYAEVGFSVHSEHETLKGAEKALRALKGQTVFAVFQDRPSGDVFYTRENRLSGNWRGSKHYPAQLVAEFYDEAKAKEEVERRKRRIQA